MSLYLDVEAVADFGESARPRARWSQRTAFQARLRALRDAELVDYAGVAAAKQRSAGTRFTAHFRAPAPGDGQSRARQGFRACQREQGDTLRLSRPVRGPAGAFPPGGPADLGLAGVARGLPRSRPRRRWREFAGAHLRADRILPVSAMARGAAARRRGRGARWSCGWGSGLYRTSPSASTVGGAEAWANQALYALGARDRLAARRLQSQGSELGPAAARSRERLRAAAYAAVHRACCGATCATPGRCASTM